MELYCQVTKQIVKHLLANGVECYIVGGYVRDHLLGLEANDIDIELHNVSLEDAFQLISEISKCQLVGHFGVIKIDETNTEFALARRETKIGMKHTDFEITYILDGDLYTSGLRRDFTINSIMYNLRTGVLVDNFNGQIDLKNKTIKHVSSKFSEDPLRVLRAYRYASRFGFTIEASTKKLCQEISDQLQYIAPARIASELEKIIMYDGYLQHHLEFSELICNIFAHHHFNRIKIDKQSSPSLRMLAITCSMPISEQLIDFLTNRNKLRFTLKYVNCNLNQILNYNNLSGLEKYHLLSTNESTLKLICELAADASDDILRINELKLKYNGQRLLAEGYEGALIKKRQQQLISKELENGKYNY